MNGAAAVAVVQQISKDDLLVQWKKHHAQAYLSHLFCALSTDFSFKTEWEVGYFDPDSGKITVFTIEQGKVIIKPADDVFQKEGVRVEELVLEKVRVKVEEAFATFKTEAPKFFPQETLGDGFLILQTFQGKTLWNITFITKSLKFVNIKINALEGKVESHDAFSMIHQETAVKKS